MEDKVQYEDNWPLFERFLGYLRYMKISKYMKRKEKPVCIDIGCGFHGRFLKSVSKKIKRGYGFDLRANEETYRNIKVINNQRFGGDIPLKDERVDIVFLLAVLEHLDPDTKLIVEASRVTKKGGLIILTTPTPFAKPVLEFLSYKLHIISEESIREHKHYYTKNELVRLLEDNGYAVKKYQKFQFGFNELIVGEKSKR